MNPFAKRYLWVFEAARAGGPRRIVDIAQATGYGLCVKAFDGNPADDGDYFSAPLAEIRALCEADHVPLIGWVYLYGNTYGNLAKEAEAVLATLDSAPFVPLVLDIEGEWEVGEGHEWAAQLADHILAQRPDAKQMLAYAPFWNMECHAAYPATELSRLCCAVMPQTYFALGEKDTYAKQRDMVDTSYREYAPFGLPVYPIGEFGVQRGVGDVVSFLSLVSSRPHSWWLLDNWQDSDEMDYLAQLAKAGDNGSTAELERLHGILAQVKSLVKEM